MSKNLFVSDLHGRIDRYEKLFRAIEGQRPRAVFLGGDLLPHRASAQPTDRGGFVHDVLAPGFARLKDALHTAYPRVFVLLGNDDCRLEEAAIQEVADRGLWVYAHGRKMPLDDLCVYGYGYVPPTPFLLKDWERYDVSRHVDPGCVSPEAGYRTVPVDEHEVRYATIRNDLERLAGADRLERSIFLFHAPPYSTCLDRAALDGQEIDHVPLDVHVGSIAIKRFIEARQPRVTLHGHIHESARLTGSWSEKIGITYCFSAAHDGDELALIRFDTDDLDHARRELL